LEAGLDARRAGAVVSVSRAIAQDPDNARAAASALRERIEAVRATVPAR
jgi:orotidine-5'-phosphate decarboxylase